ncbi:MAG: glycosyltransferase [Herpetosiphon sp.]
MSKILLLHASVGMGHHRAAVAIARGLEKVPGTVVEIQDTLDHSRSLFRSAYAGSYLGIADHAPSVWSHFYERTDRPFPFLGLVNGLRSFGTTVGVHGLEALLDRTQPDAIICTHFLPLEVLGPLRAAGLIPPLYGVLTDYRAHHFWACNGLDGYFVPTAETRDQLFAAGLTGTRVTVTGIPVDPAVSVPADQSAAREGLKLATHRPVVLLNGSGIAPARVKAIATELLARELPGTLVVAAGRNRELIDVLEELRGNAMTELRVVGPQPSLDPLIVASDVVIGKAGGLTVSEVLARGVPMVVPTPVPGQEAWNADYIVQSGAGVCEATVEGVAATTIDLIRNRPRRRTMARAALQAGRPAAATAIATIVLSELGRPSPAVAPRSLRVAQA